MGKIQNASNEMTTATTNNARGEVGIKALILKMEPQIKKALPSVMTPERFTRITLTALSSNPKLQECSPASFLGAMMTAAQLGVEPNTPLGQAYLIPFRNHGRMECQFQLGYKGMIDMAYRSGEVTIIQAHTVRENDEFSYSLGLEPSLVHVPATENRGKPTFFYAVFRTKTGGYGFEVMSLADVEEHARRYSQSYGSSSSPWKTNFEEMAKKTVLKKALKYAPMKTDFARAITADESIKSEIAPDMMDVENEIVYDATPASFTVVDGEEEPEADMEPKAEEVE